jgi:hypothetical protein
LHVFRKTLLGAAAASAALAFVTQAAAATVVINSSHVIGSDTVHLTGTVDGDPLPYPNVYEGPEAMNVSIDGGPAQDIIAFCVDLFHLWPGAPPSQTYTTAPVEHDSDSAFSGDGHTLLDPISGEIGFLADIGAHTSDVQRLAGIQGAIWAVEYPTITVNGGSSYLNYYVGLATNWGVTHPNSTSHAVGIYSVGGSNQGFGVTQGFAMGVAEPGAWALMIGGFGLAGASLRRRRSVAA